MLNNQQSQIRESIVSGSFYPASPVSLRNMIKKFLDSAKKFEIDNIVGLICPHAGYIYSGPIAAYSYKQIIDKDYDCIFIIAPSHSEYFDFNSVFTGDAYETPLGLVEIDKNRAMALIENSEHTTNILSSNYGHKREHSLEVQLPFLQVVFENKSLKIVPIVMGSQTKQNIESLGRSLGNLFKNDNVLIIASTDLSHYHSYNIAIQLDKEAIIYIENFNRGNFSIEEFVNEITSQDLEMCGGGPVAATMIASKIMGANSAKVLDYRNSGDTSGDKSAVVGYLSAAFYKA